jgi:PERQ amino acid-rich with GYF domain-containing protein
MSIINPHGPVAKYVPRPRRTNGATQTFRRPSHATSLSGSTAHSASRDASSTQTASSSGVYVPPHAQPGRNGSSVEGRFSRDQLTQLFKTQRESDDLSDGVANISMGTWDVHATNGMSGASWGRNDHSRDVPSGVDQCWDREGNTEPLSLRDLTDEERDVCYATCICLLSPTLTWASCLGLPFICKLSTETAHSKCQQRWHPERGPLVAQDVGIARRRHSVWSRITDQRQAGWSPP